MSSLATNPGECPTCGQPLTNFGEEEAVCMACLWGSGLGPASPGEAAEAAGWAIPGHDLLSELSRGGMGVVYRAQQHQPRRMVALKMLLPVHSQSKTLQERFRLEAAALAQLDHPGILPLYQFGEVDGMLYFTMKLATGGSLADLLKSGNPDELPPTRTAAGWVEILADTLHYSHQRGVLHRDIKPGNILFDEAGKPCLGDFGLAKQLDEADTGLTRSTHVMGTPCYLPPEVTYNGSKAATTSSDLYSLGAVFYELLTGRPPFIRENVAAMLRQIAEEMPEAPSSLRAAVPRDLEVICMTCLAKEPSRRYASGAELAADLRRWLRGDPIHARPAGHLERLGMWARRKPALATLSATLLVTAVGGTTLLWRKNVDLAQSLAATEKATVRAEKSAQFLLGNFADSLEDLGRVDLLDQAWSSLDTNIGAAPAAGDQRGALMSAQLFLRWSRVLLTQGRCVESEAKARAALDLATAVPPKNEAEVEREGKMSLAWALADQSQYEQAAEAIESARVIVPWTHPGAGARAQAEASLARADMIYQYDQGAIDASGTTQVSTALVHARAALVKAREWLKAEPASQAAAELEIQCLRSEARAQSYLKFPAQALTIFTEARDKAAALAALPRAPSRWRELHSDLVGWVGQAASEMGPDHQKEAEEGLTDELNITEKLLAENPGSARLRLRLGSCHVMLLNFWESRNSPVLAARERKAGLETLQSLWNAAPGVRRARLSFLNIATRQVAALLEPHASTEAGGSDEARIAAKARDFVEARALASSALEAAESEIQRRSRDIRDHRGWHQAVLLLSGAWKKAGEKSEAMEILERSSAFSAKRAIADPAAAAWWHWSQAILLRRQADLYFDMGNQQLVLDRTREALQLRVGLLKEKWQLETTKNDVPHTWMLIGQELDRGKLYAEALDSASEALRCWRDYSRDIGDLDEWIITFARAAKAATGAAASASMKTRGRDLAVSVIQTMNDSVTAAGKLGSGARKDWAALQAIAGGTEPGGEPVKTTPATPAGAFLSPQLRVPPLPQLSGENLAPALQMSLAAAQVPDRPLPRAQ